MAKRQPFLDPQTGLKRQQEQRPDGAGERWKMIPFGGWEIYHCQGEDCVFDTQWADQFDFHWFHKHELPLAKERALQAAADRARERAARMKPRETERPSGSSLILD